MYLSRTLKGIRESRPPAPPRKARPALGAAQLRRIRMPVPRDSEQNKRLANDLALVLLAYAALLRPSEIAYGRAHARGGPIVQDPPRGHDGVCRPRCIQQLGDTAYHTAVWSHT